MSDDKEPQGKTPCSKCNGTGSVLVDEAETTCWRCGSSGRCERCNGTGFVAGILDTPPDDDETDKEPKPDLADLKVQAELGVALGVALAMAKASIDSFRNAEGSHRWAFVDEVDDIEDITSELIDLSNRLDQCLEQGADDETS